MIEKDELYKLYITDRLSPAQIAALHNTYTKKIQRLITRYGFPTRTQSEAQKLALSEGRTKHPTKGRKRTREERLKMAKSQVDTWKSLDVDEQKRRKNLAIKHLEDMTDYEKELGKLKAAEAIRVASQEGSKLEKFVENILTESGLVVEYHRKGLTPSEPDLEVDLFLPHLSLAIEIDGPGHWLPIYGQESLDRNMLADFRKDSSLIYCGCYVLRIRCKDNSDSLYSMNEVASKVLELVKEYSRGGVDQTTVRTVEV